MQMRGLFSLPLPPGGAFIFSALLATALVAATALPLRGATAQTPEGGEGDTVVEMMEGGPIAMASPPGAITSQFNLQLRSSPPGFFKGKGGVVSTTQGGDVYIPLEEKKVWAFTGSETWLKVQDLESGTVGWVYGGKSPEDLEKLFKAYNPSSTPSAM